MDQMVMHPSAFLLGPEEARVDQDGKVVGDGRGGNGEDFGYFADAEGFDLEQFQNAKPVLVRQGLEVPDQGFHDLLFRSMAK